MKAKAESETPGSPGDELEEKCKKKRQEVDE